MNRPSETLPGQSASLPSVLRWGVCLELALALVALIVGALVGVDPLETIELTWDAVPWHLAAISWGAAATLPMLTVMVLVEKAPARSVRRLRNLVRRFVAPLFGGETIVGLAVISAAAGLGEEILFRGLLQAGLASWFEGGFGTWFAIGVASLVFGMAHCISRAYVVLATVIGVYLGWLFWISDHLLVPIVAHGLYDFLALIYFVKWRRSLPRRRGGSSRVS